MINPIFYELNLIFRKYFIFNLIMGFFFILITFYFNKIHKYYITKSKKKLKNNKCFKDKFYFEAKSLNLIYLLVIIIGFFNVIFLKMEKNVIHDEMIIEFLFFFKIFIIAIFVSLSIFFHHTLSRLIYLDKFNLSCEKFCKTRRKNKSLIKYFFSIKKTKKYIKNLKLK